MMGMRSDDQMHRAGGQTARQLDIACAVLAQAVAQMTQDDQHVA